MTTVPSATSGRMKQVGKFGAVGVLNTLIDFTLYNILSSRVGLTLIQSNILSTSVAMAVSFVANRRLVFKTDHGSLPKQAVSFVLVTAFGMYVLQTGTIQLLTEIWLTPISLGLSVAHWAHINNHDPFLIKNGAKAAATAVSLAWNFIMYKKVVFS